MFWIWSEKWLKRFYFKWVRTSSDSTIASFNKSSRTFSNISVVLHRRTGQIFHVWCGNSHVKRIEEAVYVVKLNKIKCESEYKKSVKQMASEFATSNSQIFVSEFPIFYKTVHFE